MSFRVIDVIRGGLFKHRVKIEALEPAIVERLRFRINAVGMSVIDSHQDIKFERGDRASACIPKKFGVGTTLDAKLVSQAVSSRRWQRLSQ